MNKYLLLTAVLLALAPSLGHAQSAAKTPPNPLFRKSSPEGRQCTAEIRYPALEKAIASGRKIIIAPYPVRRTIALQKGLVSIETKFSDGRTERKFHRNGIIMVWDSKDGVGAFPATGDNAVDFAETFPELAWVKGGFFSGETESGEGKLLVYSDEAEGRRLLVQPETLQPIRYEDRGNIYTYSYGDIPTDLIQPSAEMLREAGRVLGQLAP